MSSKKSLPDSFPRSACSGVFEGFRIAEQLFEPLKCLPARSNSDDICSRYIPLDSRFELVRVESVGGGWCSRNT
jgi:hypothetical protein